jgi:XTP/dITP diphosphohydrolase
MSRPLVLASGNRGKVAELDALLAPLGWQVQAQSAYGVPEADEPFFTFIENALTKARWASSHTGLPALADDSGLVVDALDGAPGVLSARYACASPDQPKDDDANNALLLHNLAAFPEPSQRSARFVCCLVFVKHQHDPWPLIATGTWEGSIMHAAAGANGFGYDPLFHVPTHGCSSAQLAPTEKNRISHRAQATQRLLEQLR